MSRMLNINGSGPLQKERESERDTYTTICYIGWMCCNGLPCCSRTSVTSSIQLATPEHLGHVQVHVGGELLFHLWWESNKKLFCQTCWGGMAFLGHTIMINSFIKHIRCGGWPLLCAQEIIRRFVWEGGGTPCNININRHICMCCMCILTMQDTLIICIISSSVLYCTFFNMPCHLTWYWPHWHKRSGVTWAKNSYCFLPTTKDCIKVWDWFSPLPPPPSPGKGHPLDDGGLYILLLG